MIKISSEGGYLTSWQVVNKKTGRAEEVFYQGTSLKRTGIPPLFPCWNASGTGLRKHGFARDVQWMVEESKDSRVIMTLDSDNIGEIAEKEYPHDFKVMIKVSEIESGLLYKMSVVNRGQRHMEIAPAIHPYFAVNHADKNKIKTEGVNGFVSNDFDWDNSPPDNHYPYAKTAKIILPDKTISITDATPSPVFKYLVVWSQPDTAQDFNFVCFEPITALDGAIKRREILIAPGGSWEMDIKFSVSFH